jgi:putative PIN family toxin of toxin-antitoxin system
MQYQMNNAIVLDTNVLLSGLKSNRGYSYKLLEQLPSRRFDICVSVPLILEYESVLLNHRETIGMSKSDIKSVLDYFCLVGRKTNIYYLWRPFLKDPFDDHVLEVAVNSKSRYIVTHNKKDFQNVEQFGISALTPKEFLEEEEIV